MPILSACSLHAISGCGKREAHISWSMVTCKMAGTRYRNYLEDYWPCAGGLSAVVVVVVVSHIQRIGCQPEKTTLHGGQSRSWSAEQGKENKRKSLAAYPPPPTPHTARSEKINKITRRIYRRYAGGRSRVRTRIPSARRLGLWVWLRKILHSRLR